MLALEEFNTLQQKYELESHCRFEAEKYAAEVTASGVSLNKVTGYCLLVDAFLESPRNVRGT